MTYIPAQDRIISTVNSTATVLSGAAIFTGTAEDVSDYATVSLLVYSDVVSAAGGVSFQFSTDGTNWDLKKAHTVNAAEAHELLHTITAQYFRLVYTNGAAAQTAFRAQVVFHKFRSNLIAEPLTGHIDSAANAILNKSIVSGQTNGGQFVQIGASPDKALHAEIVGPLTAFGEVRVAESTPVIQVDFIYNINTDIVATTLTGSGAVSQSASLATIDTTAATNSTATLETLKHVKYRPGQGISGMLTALFTTGKAGSEQRAGMGTAANGFFFGFNAAAFGVLRLNNSVATWTAQTAWNIDVMDGTASASNPSGMLLDPTKGNVYRIDFQYLGFGAVTFFIEEPVTGRFTAVHRIQYANANTVPSVRIPSFPLSYYAANTTNTTSINIKTSSCAAFVQGKIVVTGPQNSVDNSKAGVTTTLTNILTIRNKTTFNAIANEIAAILDHFSCAVDGTKPAVVELVLNATLGGSPSYSDVSTNTSTVDYDTAGTTVTGGTNRGSFTLAKADSISTHLKPLDIELGAGDTMTIAVKATSGTTDVSASILWTEDQ